MSAAFRVGTAGWSIARDLAGAFTPTGSALERYASVFDCAEINSSFYRSHKPETYARWAASVPETFRFSVKLPKAISHEAKLVVDGDLLERFTAEVTMLGDRLGAVLVQLAPNHLFVPDVAEGFFTACTSAWNAPTVFEPRHASWFEPEAQSLLDRHGVALVGADPARPAEASEPVPRKGIAYWRLHGAPKIYYSDYDDAAIADYATQMRDVTAGERWCIFDNTASGAALKNALTLQSMLHPRTLQGHLPLAGPRERR